jgi:hypothetical protein
MGLLDYAGDVARRIAGVAAAMLPARVWPALDLHVPATSSAFAAGLLTLFAGAAIGIPGFLHHATAQASLNTNAMLEAAVRPDIADDDVTTAMPVAATSLSLFTFLLLTPAGWATTYLGLTGLVRTVGAAFDDPRGDLILGILDTAWRRTTGAVHDHRTRAHRERLEGPVVPDRIVPGPRVGLADSDLVIVASRLKEGWDVGTVVLTDGATYRVGPIVERIIAGRLRTLYPLTEHKDLEVFRRAVRYELPHREERDV